MASTVLYMSMSLDGFVAGPNETIDNGLGDGGERLHEWVLGPASEQLEGVDREVVDEFMSTGAVLAGRGTFEPAQGWNGDHHDGVPIFILSRHQPAPEFAQWPGVTYLSDLEEAVRRAKEAAGDKTVTVMGGAETGRQFIAAGLVDEISLHVIPVLFGAGTRMFEKLADEHISLEPLSSVQTPQATHLRLRVVQ